MPKNLSIVFVRRGYSPTGGAEAYLKRLARGVIEAGHDVQLVATGQMFIADFFQICESGERFGCLPGNIQPKFDQSGVAVFGGRFLARWSLRFQF